MVNLKNQKGYVLLIVLMLIMVFTVLGLSLLTLNITSAKQFNNKEKIVQARHTAEMGALHYKAHIAKEWDKAENDINAEVNRFNGLKKKDREDYLNSYT
jgi:type II secretory pathway component PulK